MTFDRGIYETLGNELPASGEAYAETESHGHLRWKSEEYPAVLRRAKVETKRRRVNMISAISGQGNVRFMVYQDTMNQQRLICFMERLVRASKQKVFLILDNLKVHHGKLVAVWLEKRKEKIEVFFLPPYAPEYNPDEYLNHALKISVHSGQLPFTSEDISYKIQSFMRKL